MKHQLFLWLALPLAATFIHTGCALAVAKHLNAQAALLIASYVTVWFVLAIIGAVRKG